jgi:hypothetical protein
MASFYYNSTEPMLGVRCDICGNTLLTERTGQEFPEHITVEARQAGWLHRKANNCTWHDICPECAKEIQAAKRKKYIEGIGYETEEHKTQGR